VREKRDVFYPGIKQTAKRRDMPGLVEAGGDVGVGHAMIGEIVR